MAGVLGRRFSADELAALTGMQPAAILGALREALAAGLVTEDGDRLAFRHDLVREAVDASLPRTVRQSLRRQAIDVMLSPWRAAVGRRGTGHGGGPARGRGRDHDPAAGGRGRPGGCPRRWPARSAAGRWT